MYPNVPERNVRRPRKGGSGIGGIGDIVVIGGNEVHQQGRQSGRNHMKHGKPHVTFYGNSAPCPCPRPPNPRQSSLFISSVPAHTSFTHIPSTTFLPQRFFRFPSCPGRFHGFHFSFLTMHVNPYRIVHHALHASCHLLFRYSFVHVGHVQLPVFQGHLPCW